MKILCLKIEITRLLPALAAGTILALFACGGGKKDHSDNMENMEGMKQGEHDTNPVRDTTAKRDMQGVEMPGSHTAFDDSLNLLSYVLPVSQQVISTQKTVMVMPAGNGNVIKASGYITPDERRNNKVAARFSGRIEKLYVRYNLQYVKKGEKILDLYSPELNAYQEDLFFLLKSNAEQALVEKAKEKLRLLGLTSAQISRIEKTGEAFFAISIYSPQDGYILFTPPSSDSADMGSDEGNASSKTGGMGGGMGSRTANVSMNARTAGSAGSQIREGGYVGKGQTLFWVNDLRQVWAMLAVDNQHQQALKQGTPLTLKSELYREEVIHATINLIEPAYQKNQKFILSRVYLNNPGGKYKINSLVEAEIMPAKSNALVIPYSSVLFLGKRKIVWVLKGKTAENNKIFEARDVSVSVIYGDLVVIRSGLSQGEEVALDAGYLLDREGLIQPE